MLINKELLDSITEKAKVSERLRMNFNLHESLDSKVQRLFNALEQGTIVPIQRHQETAESVILVRGKMRVNIHNSDKSIKESVILDPIQGNFGYHIPAGVWHSIEILESGTVMFEVKEGPCKPLSKEDILE
ncbi:WbuC family cupin fold metalloprotein [Bacteroides ovatus]|jgi:cupin fold WbuC family metalloprotein|uniref:WbuC family cupin fold metalloprotein n=1 Tax=Bacteroides ovatus TaxID=28116 RepID=UPI00189B4D8A|nr:WbuC family cupin fold metalloprotein [Bacteroides ovatus]MDC2648978.1 WbuC family cupin fold metalloprotein [Bacteroides ovatus]